MEAQISYSNINNWLGSNQQMEKIIFDNFEQILFSPEENLNFNDDSLEIMISQNWEEENDYYNVEDSNFNWITYEHSFSSDQQLYSNYHSPVSIESNYSPDFNSPVSIESNYSFEFNSPVQTELNYSPVSIKSTEYNSPIQSIYSTFQYPSSSNINYEWWGNYSKKTLLNSKINNEKIEEQIIRNKEVSWILSPIRKYKVYISKFKKTFLGSNEFFTKKNKSTKSSSKIFNYKRSKTNSQKKYR